MFKFLGSFGIHTFAIISSSKLNLINLPFHNTKSFRIWITTESFVGFFVISTVVNIIVTTIQKYFWGTILVCLITYVQIWRSKTRIRPRNRIRTKTRAPIFAITNCRLIFFQSEFVVLSDRKQKRLRWLISFVTIMLSALPNNRCKSSNFLFKFSLTQH